MNLLLVRFTALFTAYAVVTIITIVVNAGAAVADFARARLSSRIPPKWGFHRPGCRFSPRSSWPERLVSCSD
jgi:hypothetical protein